MVHTDQRLGMRKADSAETALLEANPFVQVSKRYAALTRDNAEEIVGGADGIIDCLDNFEARHVLNDPSVRKQIPPDPQEQAPAVERGNQGITYDHNRSAGVGIRSP